MLGKLFALVVVRLFHRDLIVARDACLRRAFVMERDRYRSDLIVEEYVTITATFPQVLNAVEVRTVAVYVALCHNCWIVGLDELTAGISGTFAISFTFLLPFNLHTVSQSEELDSIWPLIRDH